MFEAVVSLCLEIAGGPCRDVLVPGYERTTMAACEAALTARPGPQGAVCQAAGPVLPVEQVAPGVFVHRGLIEEPTTENLGDVSNAGFVVGAASVAVIDTGSAGWMGEALWRAVGQVTDKPVSHVILTHMHPDHVFGVSVFAGAGAVVVGHAGLDRALADRRANYAESLARLIGAGAFIGSDLVPVGLSVAGTATIDLGGRMLEVTAWPTAHTGTDLTVLDAATGTLFAGDLVFDEHTPALDGSLRGWQAAMEAMAGQEVARIVPGHGGPVLDWPAGLAPMRRYLDVLAADTRAALDAGERLGDAVTHIAGAEAGHWTLFDAYNPRNATVAYTELEWE